MSAGPCDPNASRIKTTEMHKDAPKFTLAELSLIREVLGEYEDRHYVKGILAKIDESIETIKARRYLERRRYGQAGDLKA